MSVVGFLGTGRMTGAIVSGLCGLTAAPGPILVSPRNAEVARSLAEQFPSVRVASDNEEVVRASEVVVVALPPGNTEAVLKELSFRADQRVVSIAAMVPAARIQELVAPAHAIRALPLPSISQAMGPIAVHPPAGWATELFGPLGDVMAVDEEAHLDTIWSSTSIIAAQIEQITVTARVLEANGVPSHLAGSYVKSMLAAVYRHVATSQATLVSLLEEAQTPAGLNQQVLNQLRRAGTFDALESALNNVIQRIQAGNL